jgi:hypothetical protein
MYNQIEGMDLLEYQAMPSSRDVGHDGVLCTFSNRPTPDRGKWCGPSGQAAWTVHHVQNYTLLGLSTPASRRAAVLCHPSSLRTHCVCGGGGGEWGVCTVHIAKYKVVHTNHLYILKCMDVFPDGITM